MRSKLHVKRSGVRSCPDYAGCALRWPLLHGRSHDGRLLPADLSRAAGAIKERVLLPLSGGCRGRWLSAMPPLPSRDRPILAGMERDRTTVARGLRLIARGALDGKGTSVGTLAAKLGVGERHLLRLFTKHLGASPSQVARTARVQRAKRMLDTTDMPMSQIALAARFRQLASVQYGVLRNLWSAVNRFASQVIGCRSMRRAVSEWGGVKRDGRTVSAGRGHNSHPTIAALIYCRPAP